MGTNRSQIRWSFHEKMKLGRHWHHMEITLDIVLLNEEIKMEMGDLSKDK